MAGLAEIREADAPAEIAALYRDIRETTRLPLVNLIYRHLATIPDGLSSVWAMARPLVASGAADLAMRRIVGALPVPAIDAPAADASARASIDAVLDVYNRGNAINLLVLSTALRVIQGTRQAGGRTAAPDSLAVRPAPLPPLPALPRLDELGPSVRADVTELAGLHGGAARAGILPSLYIHLAPWPDYLHGIVAPLTAFAASGQLAAARDALLHAVDDATADLAALVPAPVAADAVPPVGAALSDFTRYVIPEMAPVGIALRGRREPT